MGLQEQINDPLRKQTDPEFGKFFKAMHSVLQQDNGMK